MQPLVSWGLHRRAEQEDAWTCTQRRFRNCGSKSKGQQGYSRSTVRCSLIVGLSSRKDYHERDLPTLTTRFNLLYLADFEMRRRMLCRPW
jgi:hypothetical protein